MEQIGKGTNIYIQLTYSFHAASYSVVVFFSSLKILLFSISDHSENNKKKNKKNCEISITNLSVAISASSPVGEPISQAGTHT